MFSKLKNSASSRFYHVPANMEEVQSGYLYKSPQQTLFKSLKSWKRRYFVLSKTSANKYELKFFKDANKREKPLGQINIYQVSLLFQCAESHTISLWIQKNFKCSASCVLYMKIPDRQYFLVGENSDEVKDWFNAIFKALNTLPDSEEVRNSRSISEPVCVYHDPKLSENQEQKEPDPVSSSLSIRQSAPESFNSLHSHYDYPKNYMMTISQSQESENTDDEDEGDEIKINKESETKGHLSYYMDMGSVIEVLRQTQNEESLFPQTNLEGSNVLKNSFLQTGDKGTGSSALCSQISPASKMANPMEKEILVSQDELKNCVTLSEEGGKVCVSNWKHTQSSDLFHEGDQILAINDLLTDSLGELQTYLTRLTKDQVKLTILRQPDSKPLSGCCT